MPHDLIVIGGGAGGLGAVRAARWVNADVALVNDGPIGGECTFTGCVPSKTLLAAAAQGLGFDDAMARVHTTIDRIAATETAAGLRAEGITVYEGRARLAGPDTVMVDGRRLRAPRIIVATGARPRVAPIPGIDAIDVMTSDDVFGLSGAPRSLAIIGGGAIGCELAEAFASLGVVVTLFEAGPRLVPQEEPESSAALTATLVARGVTVHAGTEVERMEPHGAATLLHHRGGRQEADRVLMAVGRSPNSSGLGLEELGVAIGADGRIDVDDRLRTSVSGIHAVGDVTAQLPFTHAADEMGRLAVGHALRTRPRSRFRPDRIPWAIFTRPELARVGMAEVAAAAHGGRVAYLPMTEVDRAITDDHTEGFVKLIAGPRPVLGNAFGGRLLGASIVAPRAGEMIHEIALAMRTGAFTGRLAQTVHAYPTWSYAVQKTAGQFFGEIEGRSARPAQDGSTK